MPTAINSQDCTKQLLGTGLVDCVIRFGQPLTILRTSPSWNFDPATETFNLAYVIAKIQDGTFTPFMKTLEFTNNTPDPTTKEYQGGDMAVVRNGKPQKMYEFNNGIMWHAAAYSFNGFQSNAVIEIDKAGNVRLQGNDAGTSLKAFATNMFNTRTYVDAAGDETAKTLIEYQINNEEAYNKNSVIITRGTIGADLNEEIQGIVNVTIEGTSTTTVATVFVNAVANETFGIMGLAAENFRVRNVTDSAVIVPSGVVEDTSVPGKYAITFAAQTAADVLLIDMYDDDADVATALVEPSRLYKGVSANIVVGA